MAADEVVPHIGIGSHAGMVLLGMTRAEVQPLLDRDRAIRVDFRGEPPVVAFIESPKHWGSFRGIDLFEAGADEVVAAVVAELGLDPTVYGPGRHTYYFPDLNMILWRDTVSNEDDGEPGYVFDTVSIHARGTMTPRRSPSFGRKAVCPQHRRSSLAPHRTAVKCGACCSHCSPCGR